MTENLIGDQTSNLLAFQQAVDMSLLVSVTDLKGNFKSVNKNFCEISQYSEKELLANNFKLLQSGNADQFFQQMYEAVETKGGWRGEVRHKAKDGSFYWVDKIVVPVK